VPDTERAAADAWFELELERTERVQVGSRWMVLIGVVIVLALVGGAGMMIGRDGSSDAQARISSFHAAMVEEPRFTYELDLIAENVTSAAMQDMVPGGPVEVLQIEGTVAAEDRFAMKATHSMGADEIVRVGSDLFQRSNGPGEVGSWSRAEYETPGPPSLSEVRGSLEPIGDVDASEARLRALSRIYLDRVILDPSHLPAELEHIDPHAVPDPSGDEASIVGSVPLPAGFQSVLTGVEPMVVTLQLDPDGHPRSARFEIRDADKAIIADLRFADWGADLEVVAPDGAKEATKVFEEVGTAIEDEPTTDESIDDEPSDADEVEPPAVDPTMSVWMPTSVPDDLQLVDLVAADRSGDDSCRGIFAIWMASDRPAASWVSQDTPREDNSQLLTVRSVPADCTFVERMPLFEPGPFGDRPARRIGDTWEVLLDDDWVVQLDSVVVTWEELVAMVNSLDTVAVASLEAQLR